MKAVVIRRYGGPEVLEYVDVQDPTLGPGDSLVRVKACGVTRLDVDIRSGQSGLAITLPHVLGRDMAGEVVTAPPGSGLVPGARVVAPLHLTCMRPHCRYCRTGRDNICPRRRHPGVDSQGNYAELAAYPVDTLIPLPEHLDFVTAVAGLQTFSTAWHVMAKILGVRAGEIVLVTGAGGGVGTSLVRVAQLMGAKVVAAAGAAKLERIRRLFPDADVIDYSVPGWSTAVRSATEGEGVDAIAEVVGGAAFTEALRALRPDGRLAVVGAHAGREAVIDLVQFFRAQHRILGSSAYSHSDVAEVITLMGRGALFPVVGARLPLRDAAEAHRLMDAHETVGKVVMEP